MHYRCIANESKHDTLVHDSSHGSPPSTPHPLIYSPTYLTIDYCYFKAIKHFFTLTYSLRSYQNRLVKRSIWMLHIKFKIYSTQYHMLSLNHLLMILLKLVLFNTIHVNIRKKIQVIIRHNKYLIDKTVDKIKMT